MHVQMHEEVTVGDVGPSGEHSPAARPGWLLARGWLYVPAVSGPVGGGLIKLGHGSTTAAVIVGLTPYATWALLLGLFAAGYLVALSRFCRGRTGDQEAAERLIMVSAEAVVSILTLTPSALPPKAGRRARPSRAAGRRVTLQAVPGNAGPVAVEPEP